MSTLIHVLILHTSPTKSDELYGKLSNFNDLDVRKPTESLIDPNQFFRNDHSDIVLLDADYLVDGYGLGQAILEAFPTKSVIILDDDGSTDNLKKALRMGISDVLPSSADTEDLVESVYRSQMKKLQLQESISNSKGRAAPNKVSRGKVISFFSTKGGVGTTFLAVNFAVNLCSLTKKRVALVDLNLNYGNAALALNLTVRNSINDVVNEIRNIDGDLIDSFMATHESGLKVLAANPEPQLNDFVNSDHIQVILSTLQESFDYIVLDLPTDFLEVVRPAFALTNALYMITTPEILALSNTKSSLILLREMNFPIARVRLVLNRLSRYSMSKSSVEKTLDMPISLTIPEDIQGVYTSLNIGSPYVGAKKPFKKSGSIEQAVQSFIEEEQSTGSVT